jgi:cytochrome c biogenesis protein CcdA
MAGAETAIAVGYFFGILSFFTPCAAGMVPAYLGYFLRAEQDAGLSQRRRILNGVVFGLTTTTGFVVLFGAAGLALSGVDSALHAALGASLLWIGIVAGIVLVAVGIIILLNVPIPITIPIKAPRKRNIAGFFMFGIAYGLVSFSCNLPLFISVAFASLAVGTGMVALVVLAYALGKGTMMTLASLLVAVPKESMDVKKLVKLTPRIKQLSGIGLLVGGGVMLAYYALAL